MKILNVSYSKMLLLAIFKNFLLVCWHTACLVGVNIADSVKVGWSLAVPESIYVNFPLRQLSLGEHALSGANLASYDLFAVSNHHGTMNGGHYTSYCNPPQGDVWHQCDDKAVTRLRTPVKTSTAYLLLCDSVPADI